MEYVQISFENLHADKAEVLIALLSNAGFTGFEEADETLKAFIPMSVFDENEFDKLIETLGTNYSKSIIKEINWNEKWESDFEPVCIYRKDETPFVKIRAAFHAPDTSFEHEVIITPKMSFGTGHHATTYLMVERMGEIDFKNKKVIDFGTGTGVLAILAEKLGSISVIAIDNDDWSINNALENTEINLCHNVQVMKAETISGIAAADIILANINLNVIIANLPAIKEAALPGAIMLFSGIMLTDEETLSEHILKAGLIMNKVYRRENWLAISAVNK